MTTQYQTEFVNDEHSHVRIGQCALFIDAGYLFAAAGQLILHTSYRPYIDCDYAGLIGSLIELVQQHANLPLLRVYWYDAAYNAVPTPEQLDISALPFVKLRLGRLVAGRQKGVDSLIVRDMMTLSRERAIIRAYLLGGDEDVREGVLSAQDVGASVVLLGIPGGNQALTLIREADHHWVLDANFWEPYFRRAQPKFGDDDQFVASNLSSDLTGVAQADDLRRAANDAGAAFAREWARTVTTDEVRGVRSQPAWRIPADVDSELLRAATQELGAVRIEPELRKSVRAGFHSELAKVLAEMEETEPTRGGP